MRQTIFDHTYNIGIISHLFQAAWRVATLVRLIEPNFEPKLTSWLSHYWYKTSFGAFLYTWDSLSERALKVKLIAIRKLIL